MNLAFRYIEVDERARAIHAYAETGATLAGLTISEFIGAEPTYHREELVDVEWQSQSAISEWVSTTTVQPLSSVSFFWLK